MISLIGASCMLHFDKNKISILIFAAICGFFQFFHNKIYYLVGSDYYLGAALIDLSIIYFLSTISSPTKLICMLQKACLWLIYMNLFGWIIYEAYIEPLIYNILCESLFVAVLLISINKRKKDGLDNNSIYSNSGLFFSNNPSCALEVQINKEKTRS